MNKKRVQMLRDMMEGIPDSQIELDEIFRGDRSGAVLIGRREPPKPCVAVACMGGWALLYPSFVKAGIRRPIAKGRDPIEAVQLFFKIDLEQGSERALFYPRQYGEVGTDKEVALRRLDALLR